MDKQMYKELIAEYMRREAELLITISELKDKIESLEKNQYAETDGYEVGSPSDYEEDKQLNLFND